MKILFHGNDSFLSLQEVRKYIEKLTIDGIERITVDATTLTGNQIISSLSTDDMFSNKRVLLVKRLLDNKNKEDVVAFLIDNIEKLNPDTQYIFWEQQKVPSNTKYFKLFKNDLNEFSQMNKPGFYAWAKDILDSSGIKSDRETIIYLSNRVNFSTERLINEVEKYKLNQIDQLTTESIAELTADTLESQIWDLTDAINSSTKEKIYQTLNKLYSQEIDSNFIIAILARNMRLITQVKHMESQGKTSRDICSKLRIPPFTLPSLSSNAKRTDWDKIKYIYDKVASLDFEIKIGNIDAQTGLTLLLSRV